MYISMIHHPKAPGYDLSSLEVCISGAAPLPLDVQERFEAMTGARLIEGYGLTEASPVTHANNIWAKRKIGSIGIPFPDTEAKIVHPDTGEDVPAGEIGELIVRGPQVMRGYWNRPEETAQTLLEGGWLRTGDLVAQDEDGFVTVVDRKKEIIITGGFNVAPSEVEKVILSAPGVAAAAVVGVPRGGGAEVVTAVVVPEPGTTFDEDAVRELVRSQLAEYKRPTSYRVWEELPTSLIGKVLRRRVRDTLIADRDAVRALPTEE